MSLKDPSTHQTHPSVDIIVGRMLIVNYRLVIAENVEAEAVRRPIIVEENASEQIGVILNDNFYEIFSSWWESFVSPKLALDFQIISGVFVANRLSLS